ncbi:MAG: InlB B-repeat-containing protein [Alphaproteobacteria bacterium]|nr:InlB B-repeat-containing protein [Alphaproteobacteria bacterium]
MLNTKKKIFDAQNIRRIALRLCCAFAFIFIMFTAANACTTNQITLSDNSCVDVKFTITTTAIKNKSISINISAQGMFYIEWEPGNVEVVDRTNTTTNSTYSNRYGNKNTERTIRIGGLATAYSTSDTTAAISFTSSAKYIAGISGSLTDLFPEYGTGDGQSPIFYRTFYNCSNLESNIPENLFRGITTASTYTFYYTFSGCTKLSGFIPPSAFGGLIQNNSPYTGSMMRNIFYNTSALATSCVSPHRNYTTNYESYWDSRVSCGTEYALTYVMNGGTNYAGAPTTFWDDAATTINGIPTKTNNVFTGWCTDSGLVNCSMTHTIPIYTITPQTLYAAWQPCNACATTNASCTLNVVNNTCTYTTTCNAGYENIQNNGAYNAVCSPISTGTCPAGDYRENGVCVAVGAGYWSADNSDIRTQCATGLTTVGYGHGADEASDCGRKLHLGDFILYTKTTKPTLPAINVRVENDSTTHYVGVSDTDQALTPIHVTQGNTQYTAFDDSILYGERDLETNTRITQ